MESWLWLVLVCIVAWGSSAVLLKVVANKNYFGLAPGAAALLMLLGIVAVFASYFALQPSEIPSNPALIGLAVLAGIVWAVGQVFLFIILNRGAEVAKAAPLYNINTLVAVVLGILLLGELPAQHDALRVVIGAILIVIGGFLVAF